MLISYHWLQEFVQTSLTPQELRDRLTMVGLAIDAVESHGTDSILDVEVPSNRPDCLSHVGIAREVAVIDHGLLRIPPIKPFMTAGKTEAATSVEIKDARLCPRYTARLVTGVKIGPSPEWLTERLLAIGQRPINNVADITNYILHELGQPLHAFDFARLLGGRIVVRRALKNEKLKTLDGVDRVLTDQMLVIADGERPVALAGIMGGEDSEINADTVDVLIESAYFDPDSVRKTARSLSMDTEASRRFERGADRDLVLYAQERCVQLICELAGGVATENAIDVYPEPIPPTVINFRTARVQELTSLSVPSSAAENIFRGLGFEEVSTSASGVTVRVPSYRVDVELEEDLVEEVARHVGYDHIASELPPSSAAGEYQPSEMKQRVLRRALNAFSFDEAINFSFVPAQPGFELIPDFEGTEVRLENPIIEDASLLRKTLVPGLLNALRHNLNHGTRDIRLFEIGRIFSGVEGSQPLEKQALALVSTGGVVLEGKALSETEVDFFDMKGALETAIDWINLKALSFAKSSASHFQKGQAAAIHTADGTLIGTLGRLADQFASAYKFRQPVYIAELDLDALLASPEKPVLYSSLARYPSVVRDLSLLLDRTTSFKEIVQAIKAQKIDDCDDIKFVGTYEGANIPEGKRSLTVRIAYRSDDRTLRDEEVEERHQQLTSQLLKTFNAEQR